MGRCRVDSQSTVAAMGAAKADQKATNDKKKPLTKSVGTGIDMVREEEAKAREVKAGAKAGEGLSKEDLFTVRRSRWVVGAVRYEVDGMRAGIRSLSWGPDV